MKENSDENKNAANTHIDELLNSFIDGELRAAQQAQVERLITRDVHIAQRLRQLQRCRILVGSLPRTQAPLEVAEGIKASVRRHAVRSTQNGPRRMLVRRVLSTAAMIGLVAVLVAVIYTILTPQAAPERPVAIEPRQIPGQVPAALPGFSGRLELKTGDLAAISAFVNRAIEDKELSDTVLRQESLGQRDKHIYSVSCNAKQFNSLLADLATIWPQLDSATLFVNTEVFGKPVAVNHVTTGQIAQIADQNNLQKRIEVAKGFDALNTLVARLPDRQIQAAIEGANNSPILEWRAPKPVLTSPDRQTARKPPSEAQEQQTIHLTIVVNW